MIYRKVTFFCLLILFLITAVWFWKVCVLTTKDKEAFVEAKKKQQALEDSLKTTSSSAYQTREGVRKDLWISQEDSSRLHYRIDSRMSILTLIPREEKVDIIENLQDIKCWMQDRVYTEKGMPMQQMRFFAADHGTYQYSAQQFVAQAVKLYLFRLGGHDLVTNTPLNRAYLQGVAHDASFSLSGKTTAFQAEHFKASLNGSL